MDSQRVSVEKASKVLGMTPEFIRYTMEREMHKPQSERTLPIGQAMKGTGKQLRYLVYKNKVLEFTGLSEWPEQEDLS